MKLNMDFNVSLTSDDFAQNIPHHVSCIIFTPYPGWLLSVLGHPDPRTVAEPNQEWPGEGRQGVYSWSQFRYFQSSYTGHECGIQ